MKKLSFVTVIHSGEINILGAQAASFHVNVEPECIDKILLVVNEPSFDFGRLDDALSNYGALRSKVTILPGEEVAPELPWKKGWWAQQVLKLRAAAKLTTTHYVVLDSKNQFIKRVDYDSFITQEGRVKTWFHSYRNNAELHCRESFKYFGLDAEQWIDSLPPSITPITLTTQLITEMMAHVESKCGSSFDLGFISNLNTTEFLLYYAYLKMINVNFDDFFCATEPLVSTIFRDKIENNSIFSSVIFKSSRSSTLMFGVHREVVPLLTEWQRLKIYEVWQSAGLTNQKEEMETWLTPD